MAGFFVFCIIITYNNNTIKNTKNTLMSKLTIFKKIRLKILCFLLAWPDPTSVTTEKHIFNKLTRYVLRFLIGEKQRHKKANEQKECPSLEFLSLETRHIHSQSSRLTGLDFLKCR